MMTRNSEKTSENRFSEYAARIRSLREDKDLSQKKAAALIHVAQRTYSDYERDKVRIPVESLITLAKYYDVDMNYICGVAKEKKPFPK